MTSTPPCEYRDRRTASCPGPAGVGRQSPRPMPDRQHGCSAGANPGRDASATHQRRPAHAVTASDLATAAVWSYGLAAVGYAAFALRLALGWRRVRARHAAARGDARHGAVGGEHGRGAPVAVAVRAGWRRTHSTRCAMRAGSRFVAYLLRGAPWTSPALPLPRRRCRAGPRPSSRRRWSRAWRCLQGTCRSRMSAAQGRMTEFALRLGLAVFGLILVEQLLRRAHPQARWGIKPLCSGSPACSRFDLFFYADAMLFGRARRRHLGRARRRQRAGHSVHRDRDGAQYRLDGRDAHVARRRVPLHGAAGVGRLPAAVAGGRLLRPLFRRRLGPGAADRAAVRRAAARRAGRVVGPLPLEAEGLRQQAFLLLSLRLPRGVAAVHAHAVGGDARCRDVQERLHQGARRPGRKPGRRALAATTKAAASGRRALEHAGGRRRSEPADGSLARFLERTGWVVNLGECASDPARYPGPRRCPAWLAAIPAAWLVVPLVVRHRADRLRRAGDAARARSTSTGRCATCSRRRAGRRRATSARSRRPRRCSRRASSTPSTGCRRLSSTI